MPLRLLPVINKPGREEPSRFRFVSFPKRAENARGRNFPLIPPLPWRTQWKSKFA